MRTGVTRLILLALLVPAQAGASDALASRLAELQQGHQAQDARITRLEAQMQNQGLLNLLSQFEALRAEVARLRGAQEELAHQQDGADKRVKDLLADMDDRLRELENRPVAPPPPLPSSAVRLQPAQALGAARAAAATPAPAAAPTPAAPAAGAPDAETRAYEAAHQLVKAGRYREAVLALQAFVRAHPNSRLVPNAHYWTGFSYVGMSDFDSAAASYQFTIQNFPNSPKTPDTMLSLARAQVQMNRVADAIATLETLIARFPHNRAAEGARRLLATLR